MSNVELTELEQERIARLVQARDFLGALAEHLRAEAELCQIQADESRKAATFMEDRHRTLSTRLFDAETRFDLAQTELATQWREILLGHGVEEQELEHYDIQVTPNGTELIQES